MFVSAGPIGGLQQRQERSHVCHVLDRCDFLLLIDFLLNSERQRNTWYSAHALWWRATWDCHLPAVTPQQAPYLAHGKSVKTSVWINNKIIDRQEGFSAFDKPYFSKRRLTVPKKTLCGISKVFFYFLFFVCVCFLFFKLSLRVKREKSNFAQ